MMRDKEPAKMVRPANKIKQKLGPAANIRDLLKPESVQQGQMTIDAKKDEFLQWAHEDVGILRTVLPEIQHGNINSEIMGEVVTCAEHLRDRGGTFGYDLLSQIAKSLVNYCATIQSPSPEHAIVISKHIEGMTTVLSNQVEGSGGAIGIELLKGLKQLTDKYHG